MGRLVRMLVAAAGAALIAGAPAATAATSSWETSLSIPDDPASIEALSLGRPGPLLAAGGRNVPGAYDQPTVWRLRQGTWRAERLPVDLSNSWGYATTVAQTPGDAWAGGWTTNQTTGGETPFLAHWHGGHWSIVSNQWLDPTDAQGAVAAVVARGPQDVWLVVNEGGYAQGLTEAAVWHFDGRFWQRQPAMPLRNKQCAAGYGFTITSAALTATDLLVSANCTTLEFKGAGVVERLHGHFWHRVLALPGGTGIQSLAADPGGAVWAAGSAAGGGGLASAAAWAGDDTAMAQVYVPAPGESMFWSVAVRGARVVLAGEAEQVGGPGPLLISSKAAGGWRIEGLPYDRALSGTAIDGHGRLWAGGPLFGGWIGGTPPHAAVLTRTR